MQRGYVSLARHYKNKYIQQRSLIDRLKNEFKAMKKTLEDLKAENAQLQQYAGYQGMPSDIQNANGKRRMLYNHQHPGGVRTNSSPRSAVTPIGPDRLTLPPDRQQPSFAPVTQAPDQSTTPQRNRPGSSRFVQQYGYQPAHAAHPGVVHASLSHEQAAPRQALARQAQAQLSSGRAHISTQGPSFNDATAEGYHEAGPSSGSIRPIQGDGFRGAGHDRTQMPPPPTPQMPRTSLQQRASFRPPATPQLQPSGGSHRFLPPTPVRPRETAASNRALLQQPRNQQVLQTQRFSGPSNMQSFSGLGGRSSGTGQQRNQDLVPGSSRAASFAASGGQRTPFVPNR